MMRCFRPMTQVIAVATGFLLLAGCGSSDTAAKKDPMPMEETVYGDQIRQMNRVREETSKLSSERMDQLNKQIEGSGEEKSEDQSEGK